MRRYRAALLLEALAAVALAVALIQRVQVATYRWESYVPLSSERDVFDSFDGLGPLDARLWLGVAIGMAVAGLVAAVASRRA